MHSNVTVGSARNGYIIKIFEHNKAFAVTVPASVSDKRKKHFYESSSSSEVNTKEFRELGSSKPNTGSCFLGDRLVRYDCV